MGYRVVAALLLSYVLRAVDAKFFQFGEGACPTLVDDEGTVVEAANNRDKCLGDCLTEKTLPACGAFEFDGENLVCKVFTEINVSNVSGLGDALVANDLALLINTTECFVKEFVPFFETTKAPLVAAMVVGVFLLHLIFLVNCCCGMVSRYRANQQRRKKRQSASNVRIVFDRRGQVVQESVMNAAELQLFDRLLALLRTLGGGLALGNATLYKHHASLARAMDVAERCAGAVRKFLSLEGEADLTMVSTFEGAVALLTELTGSLPPSGDVESVLDDLCQELAVLYAAFSEDSPDDSGDALAEAFGERSLSTVFAKKRSRTQAKPGLLAAITRGFAAEPPAEAPPMSTGGFWSNLFSGWAAEEPAPQQPTPQQSARSDDDPLNVQIKERVERARAALGASAKVAAQAEALEPLHKVNGVRARDRQSLLASAVDIRDMFGIGSRRILVAVVVIILSGPVRFVGAAAGVVLMVLLLACAATDALRSFEARSTRTKCFHLVRMSAFVLAGVLLLVLLTIFRVFPSESNGELEGRFTFLPVPPQYDLSKIGGQALYVSLIFGIMHANLLVLCLLPLPVAYGLQAFFVRCCPRLRFWVPQNPVWLHRVLGYALVGGISFVGVLWLIFQGNECFLKQTIQACEAFDPETLAGIDVYVLRFHIVWPLLFFLIPLMIYPRYPGDLKGSRAGATRGGAGSGALDGARAGAAGPTLLAAAPAAGSAKAAKGSADGAKGDELVAASSAGPAAAAAAPAAAVARATPAAKNETCSESLGGFLYRRMLDVILYVVVLSGCVHIVVQDFEIFMPYWFIVAVPLVLTSFFQFRSFLASLCGERCGLRKGSELADLVRKSWWELAYASHVFAFLGMAFWALYYRFTVFFPMLLPWGLYLLDRAAMFIRAYWYPLAIKVGEANSSYAVNQGVGKDAAPSHVRLVLRKPPGFTYKAGQWCHLAMPSAGAYWGCPGIALPFLQWHAFSIASKESDDFLEFHIQAFSSAGVLEDGDAVWASKAASSSFVKLARRGRWTEWLCPHRVPYFGQGAGRTGPKVGSRGTASARMRVQEMGVKGNFVAESAGLFFNLSGEDGITLKTSKPQLQWTGRLWNTVQWLVEERGRTGEAPEPRVYVMGPYGTLPYTVRAHPAVMLIGAGVGYPSTGAMLRQILEENSMQQDGEQTRVCFMWTASKVNQLLLCFPSLLVDLTRYVHARGLADLKRWLHVKIFISSFEAGDVLSINPDRALFPEDEEMRKPLQEVRSWLLGTDTERDGDGGEHIDADGTYVAQGSLGSSFAGILQKSLFTRETVARGDSMGICFCGPPELSSWIRSDVANTKLPIRVEFTAEVAA